ncbi:MAG: hypothetical protein ACT6FC_05020 [Methanosarcinaceae archaeon]
MTYYSEYCDYDYDLDFDNGDGLLYDELPILYNCSDDEVVIGKNKDDDIKNVFTDVGEDVELPDIYTGPEFMSDAWFAVCLSLLRKEAIKSHVKKKKAKQSPRTRIWDLTQK